MVKLNAYTTWATGAGGLIWVWVLALTAGLALEMSALLWYGVISYLTASCAGRFIFIISVTLGEQNTISLQVNIPAPASWLTAVENRGCGVIKERKVIHKFIDCTLPLPRSRLRRVWQN